MSLSLQKCQCLDSCWFTHTVSLVLSSCWQHFFFTYFYTSDFDLSWSKWPIPWPLLTHKRWYVQVSLRGHWGQKEYFSRKKASSPSGYVALTRDFRICINLTHSTKVMILKIRPGSFGATRIKRSFSLNVTQHDHKTHSYSSARDYLPMLTGQVSIWGHLWSLGSKGNFLQ